MHPRTSYWLYLLHRFLQIQWFIVSGIIAALERPLDALEYIADFPTDLLITNYNMDLVKLLRTHTRSPAPALPIVMVSTVADETAVMAARDAGVDEFLARPVEPDDLYDHIRNTLQNRRPIVAEGSYRGPDRRRHHTEIPQNEERRKLP